MNTLRIALDYFAHVTFPHGQWQPAKMRDLDKGQVSDVWDMFTGSYRKIGLPIQTVGEMAAEYKEIYAIDTEGDGSLNAFSSSSTG